MYSFSWHIDKKNYKVLSKLYHLSFYSLQYKYARNWQPSFSIQCPSSISLYQHPCKWGTPSMESHSLNEFSNSPNQNMSATHLADSSLFEQPAWLKIALCYLLYNKFIT